MKKVILFVALIVCSVTIAQESPNDGFLPSRVTTTDRDAFVNPGKGLIIFNTTTNTLQMNEGTGPAPIWVDFVKPGASGATVAVTAISPIHSASGKVWMDRNLGASRKAQSLTDHLAYGQIYQWGRGNDGHADINWTSATGGTVVNGTTATLSTTDYPADNLFITTASDWRTTKNDNLWQGVNGVNNPCPAGYRVPTNAELTTEVTTYSIANSADAFASPLKFTVPGGRSLTDGSLYNAGLSGYYWSSSISGNNASRRYFNSTSALTNASFRVNGFSVRCIRGLSAINYPDNVAAVAAGLQKGDTFETGDGVLRIVY